MLAFCEGKNILNSQFDKYALNGSYVLRDSDPSSSYDDDFFNAGICPAGQQDTIYEPYQNLALRSVEGTDIAIYYDFETSIGDFSVTLQSSINPGVQPSSITSKTRSSKFNSAHHKSIATKYWEQSSVPSA